MILNTDDKIVKEWFHRNLQTHTDWTGTRVETKELTNSIKELVENFLNFLEENKNKNF